MAACIGIFLRHNLPLYFSVAALILHSFHCNLPDELRTKKAFVNQKHDQLGMNVSALRASVLNLQTTTRVFVFEV